MTKQVDGLFAGFNSEMKATIPLPVFLGCHKTIKMQNQAWKSIRQQPGNGETKQNKNKLPSYDCWGTCAAQGATQVLLKSLSVPGFVFTDTRVHHKLIRTRVIFHNTVLPAQN